MDGNWSSDALQALKLRFVRSKADEAELSEDEDRLVRDFEPTFVYPIFGQEETIFGYHNLEIQLRFASGSLRQYLHVKYDDKFPETATVKADDPEQTLYEFIPPSYLKNSDEFAKVVEQDAKEFQPYGTKIGSIRDVDENAAANVKANGKGKGKAKSTGTTLPDRPWQIVHADEDTSEDEVIFEAYWSNWDTPGFKEYHRRMQIFVLLYIEGAQYIDEEDPRWEFVTLQFVLTGPYQSQGYGSALYTLCYQNLLTRPEISELTVEDPSEAFEDMRDKCDLYTLIKAGALENITAPFDKSELETIRKRYKLADRQFYRLVEMILLLQLDTSNKETLKAFRLTVKRRLYLFNKETMSQLEEQEKKDKLQETYDNVIEGYKRVSEKFSA
ncbi:histone acetyltransferase 1 [Microbotryomycetes sp. JL201]|nr:histone acetyltransferase 1 [Microbotryomycetes sp. JL201]